MAQVIEQDCQRRHRRRRAAGARRCDTSYDDITFKLMLLPVWLACYIYAGKTYNILVNGRTGEVVGERPYSKVKIALAILAGLVALGLVAVLYLKSQGG